VKKALILFVFLFIAVANSTVYAQSPGLTIKLLDALSFKISQPENLNLEYINNDKIKGRFIATIPDHITVISSRGYEVRAVSGSGNGMESNVSLTSYIGKTNKGNTSGIVFGRSVELPSSKGSAATIISASNTSWNGINPENKFDIDYSVESGNSSGKGGTIPVIFTVLQP